MIQISNERIDALEKMLKLSKDDQTRHINYLAKSPIEIRLDLFEKQREVFYPLSQKYKDHMSPSDISYGALILAIGVTRAIEKKLTQKSFETLSIDEIRDLSSSRAVSFKQKTTRGSHKHEKLMSYWAIVRTLRIDHGYSYERVSLYLKKKHRFSIAPSTIMKKWKEIETPNTLENGL
ncbi:MAG: hypothetical protein PHQ22_08935 [Sulfuricurvum sp.]|nr:hypothetical protein [Sulfuricurvum sp.]